MAIYGRRQPHAPIILVGAKPPVVVLPPVPRPVLPKGQLAAQAAADRFFRRSFPPKVIRAAPGRQPVGQYNAVFLIPVQTAALVARRKPFPPLLQPIAPPVFAGGIRYFIKT